MNISIFSSEKFAPLLKIMLLSLCESNDFEKHNIYIITTDMKKETEEEINKTLDKKYGQRVRRVIIDSSKKMGFEDSKLYSVASYHKLYAFRNFPKTVDRILCLDADMIIKKSLKDFYYQNMEGKTLSAAEDFHISTKEKENIGLNKDDKYVNLGCLLIDVQKFNSKYLLEEYVAWTKKWKPRFVAQDVVNALFKDDIKIVEDIYNYQIFSSQKLKASDENYYKCKELSRARRNYVRDKVVVIHYVGELKPNNFRFISKSAKYFYGVMFRNNMKIKVAKLISFNLLYKCKKILKGELPR